MRHSPRGRDDPLVTPFTCVRYIVTGTYVGVATVGAFLYWYHRMGVPWQRVAGWTDCSEWAEGVLPNFKVACTAFDKSQGTKLHASSVALSTLVAMEMLRALCAVSESSSLLQIPPWTNKWLLAGVALPSFLHASVLYTPALAQIFQLAPLTSADWGIVLTFALPLVLIEELLKLSARSLAIIG